MQNAHSRSLACMCEACKRRSEPCKVMLKGIRRMRAATKAIHAEKYPW